ncbi:MAG TPA: tetratricopeptide repeat protein [Armatimonadota bacterium]|nr:tetratricopeptide repeat protein [Armatimonadota bacterium]
MGKPGNSQLKKTLVAAGALILLTLIVYLPAIHCGYVWDDDAYVTANPLLTDANGLKRIWFSFDSPSQYFPLVYTTFRIEHAFWGFDPLGYHLVNVLIHIINALLVWLVLSKLGIRGAWLAGAIFALHPVNVESVAWITERKNTLSTLFYLLTIIAWLRYEENSNHWYYKLAFGTFALSLFAKTTACMLPFTLLILMWLKGLRINRQRIGDIAPFFIMAGIMGTLTVWWERHHQGTYGEEFSFSAVERMLIAGRAIWFYLGKLVWPTKLSFSYAKWGINAADPRQYVWVAALIILAIAIWRYRKIGKGLMAAPIFFVITLIPMLGFFSLYTFRYSFVADHYQYVACLGPIALFSWIIFRKWRWAAADYAIRFALPVLILGTLGVLTWQQTHIYMDEETIWTDTLAKNPDSVLAHDNLGTILGGRGQYEESIEHYKAALRISPDFETYQNIGVNLSSLGNYDAAIEYLNKALELCPNSPAPHFNLAVALYRKGDYAASWKEVNFCLQNGVDVDPSFLAALSEKMPEP